MANTDNFTNLNLTNITLNINSTSPDIYEKASSILWIFMSPIFLLFGLVGNTVAFLVLFKIFRKQKSTFHLFLAVLSLNDLVVLYSGLLRYWIIYVFDFDVRDLSNASCKLQLFVIYTSMQYSAWILVSVTLQRCLVVARPSKFKQIYTPKFTALQLTVLLLTLSAVNFHFFFTNGITKNGCNSLTEAIFRFEEYVFVWIDLFILCVIPFLIMLLSNIYFMANVEKISNTVNAGDNVINQKIRHSIRIIMRLTWLFLFTNLPISIYLIFDSYSLSNELVHSICFLNQYAGFALNICLYVSVDRKFLSVLRKNARSIQSSFRSLRDRRSSSNALETFRIKFRQNQSSISRSNSESQSKKFQTEVTVS